jgi:bacterioferritin-associated ferredoxin
MNYMLTKSQAETQESDGQGKTKSSNGESLLEVFIKIRKDSQIPEFDAITSFKIYSEGFEEMRKYHDKLSEILEEMGGMFVEDALKLEERDIFSMLGEDLKAKDRFVIPALKAFKKAIIDYFKRTGQDQRAKKVSQKLVCICRHVTNHDIEEAVANGHDSFEKVQMVTGAGSGCTSCVNKTKELIDQFRKTSFGKINDSIQKDK